MKAVLFTYRTKNFSKSESSKISKKIRGYSDKSNQSKYNYQREGIINRCGGVIVSKSTFIIPKKHEKEINKLEKRGLKISRWEIDLPKSYFLA
jgi:hypothetical protein